VQKGRESDGKTEIYGTLNPGDSIVQIANEEIRKDAEITAEK